MVGLVRYPGLGNRRRWAVAIDAARDAAAGSAWSGVMHAMSMLVKIGIVAGLVPSVPIASVVVSLALMVSCPARPGHGS
jgi:hypothetical protein